MSFLLVFLMSSFVGAKELEYAPVTTLQNHDEPSSLEIYCKGQKPFITMNCEFTQKSIRTITPHSTEEQMKLIANMPEKEKKKSIKEVKNSCKKLNTESFPKHNLASINNYKEDSLKPFSKLCSCMEQSDMESCFKEFLITSTKELDEKTCRIGVNTFEYEFKKISKNKWMNQPTPQGLCNTVNAITLEFDGKYDWTFTQTRISSDKTELCNFEINKPVTYSTGTMIHKANCTYIDLGPAL